MPTRRKFLKFYGSEHRAHREKLIALFGPRCMACGRKIEHYVQAAHSTHNPRLPADRVWCAPCHTRHDTGHRMAVARRNRARRAGQRWLLPEIERAADPERKTARPAADAQGGLFE